MCIRLCIVEMSATRVYLVNTLWTGFFSLYMLLYSIYRGVSFDLQNSGWIRERKLWSVALDHIETDTQCPIRFL